MGYFLDFWVIFEFFGQILRFLIKITWFLSFSGKNDAESLCHFVKIPFWDLKRAKLHQKSEIGHVRTCQDLFLLSKFIIFYKIIGFNKKIYHFYKIISFTKQIYAFMKSSVLPNKLIIFSKINSFTKQIYHFSNPYRIATFIFF